MRKAIELMRTMFAVLFFAFAITVQAAKIVVPVGEYELTASQNASGNTLAFSGDTVLKVNGSVVDGTFELKAAILFESAGTVTFDTAALGGCSKILSRRHIRDNGNGGVLSFPVNVKEFRIGSESLGSDNAISFPSFEADACFASAEGRVIFENDVTLIRLPQTAPWMVASGSRVAVFGTNVFGSEDYHLTDFDVQVGSASSFAAGTTVTVPSGRRLLVRICTLKSTPADGNLSTWSGVSGAVVPMNVHLASGTLVLRNNVAHTYTGDVSGTGNVEIACGGETVLGGDLSFVGGFVCNSTDSSEPVITLRRSTGTTFADVSLKRARGPIFQFSPAGAGEQDVTASISAFTSETATGYPTRIVALSRETVLIGTLNGNVCASGNGDNSRIVIDELGAGSILWVEPNVEVTVNAAAVDAQILFKEKDGMKTWQFNGPTSGNVVLPKFAFEVSGGALTLGGNIELRETLSVSKLTLKSEAEVLARLATGTKVINRGGSLKTKSWRDRAILWNDATVASSFVKAKESLPLQLDLSQDKIDLINKWMTDEQIVDWLDCRTGGLLRLRQTRYDPPSSVALGDASGYYTVFPSLKTQDGFPCLYCDKAATRARIYTATGIGGKSALSVKCAMFVFNGALGGGTALFCGDGKTFQRVASIPTKAATYPTIEDPIVLDNVKNLAFRKNGSDVDCTKTGLDSGWQVLAFTSETAVSISAIGPYNNSKSDDTSGNGGQIFGEVLFFSEVPTQDEILEMEKYLADKWNVEIVHQGPSGTKSYEMFGDGEMQLEKDTVLSGGSYSGTIDLAGKRLSLPAGEHPFTAAEIPATGRVLWADPSLEGAAVVGEVPSKPDEMTYLKTRDKNGVLQDDGSAILFSPYSESADRRVRIVRSGRRDGQALPWMEFANVYSGDSVGNFLYFAQLPYQPMENYTDKTPPVSVLNIKSGFFAIDSTEGGGTVLSSTAGGAQPLAARSKNQVANSEPIFNSSCSESVRNASAWLDGVAVSPSSTSYSLRPEVFAFSLQEADAAVAAKNIGYSANDVNLETIGEVILYSKSQDALTIRKISAYLMAKWLGCLPDGFVDFRQAMVTGAGTLEAVNDSYLPILSAGFTGEVILTQSTWSFNLAEKVEESTGLVDLSGHDLALPSCVTVNVNCSNAVEGLYPLFRFGELKSETEFVLGTVKGTGLIKLVRSKDGLYAKYMGAGFVMSFR